MVKSVEQIYYFIAGILLLSKSKKSNSAPIPPVFSEEKIIELLKSGEVNWERFSYMTSHNLVLPAIYNILENNDLSQYLPEKLSYHLKDIFDMNIERNNTVIGQLYGINDILRSAGIVPIFMKGAANIIDQFYPSVGERIIGDVDLLVDPDQMEKAVKIMMDNGFYTTYPFDFSDFQFKKHFPPLVREGLPVSVEIHRMPVNIFYDDFFSYEKVKRDARGSRLSNKLMVMSDRDKIVMNFIHSQLGHNGHYHALPSFRDLYDLLILSNREDVNNILSKEVPYTRKSICYLRIFTSTFGLNLNLSDKFKESGKLCYNRHLFGLQHPRKAQVLIKFLNFLNRYLFPFTRSIYNKTHRRYLYSLLSNPEFYKRKIKGLINLFR